jgi:hypothetical protein
LVQCAEPLLANPAPTAEFRPFQGQWIADRPRRAFVSVL